MLHRQDSAPGTGASLWRLTAALCAVLSICTVGHAQSAIDGFDPGANASTSRAWGITSDTPILGQQ